MDSVLRFEIPWKTSTRMRKLWFHFVVALCVHGLGFHPTAGTNAVTAFYIQEGSAVDSVVGSLTITPPFVLVAGTPPSYQNDLKLVQNRIVTKTILNRERVDSYNLTIVKIPATKYEVIVYVLDLNDNSPTFIGGSSKKVELYECNQMQVIKCPSFRRKLMAVDPDFGSNSTQSYTIISGNTNSTFKLVTNRDNNGDLYADLVLNTNKTIDYEVKDVYVLNISASDGGNPARIGYLNLSISVIDINDNEPVFANQTYRASVREDAAVPTSILQVFASDKDAGTNAQVQYSIETYSNTLAIFGIHPTTGVIVNNVALDFEKTSSYDIVVKAEDKGSSLQLSKTAVVNIQVLDVNDNDPHIHVKYSLGGSYQVTEDAIIGTVVVFVSVTDADSGSNGEVNVTLEGGSGYFRMKYNALTRESIISVGKSLDREEQHFFELKAVASDQGNPPRTSQRSFRINVGDVNDNRPKFDRHTYVTRILENATVNTLVANVHATDRDAGSNAELVYSIANTSQSMEYRHWFSINPTSGEITTAASLDREQVSQIELLVVVTDKGQPSLSANCTVVVNLTDYNDNDPYFNQSMYNASVIENSGPGSSVVQLFAKDPDIGENSLIQYSLSSQNIPFLVDAHTGLVTTTRTLDHEQLASYTFQVAATDGGGRRTLANVHVKVVDLNDNSPVFNPTSYNVQHLENIPIGHAVCELTATDKDSGLFSKLNYVIEQGNSDKVFMVNGSGFIVLAKTIDRETKDSYTLTVNAFDGGGRESTNKAVVTVTVLDVNDEPPIFSRSLYNFSVVEHSPALTVIGSVSATSRDDGTNAEITYSVISGNTDNIITINGTGTLYLQAEIDHEKTPMLHLRVQAKDKGTPPLYGFTNVSIIVLDINDHTPRFNNSNVLVSLPEDSAVGQPFYTVAAFDADSDDLGRVTYSLVSNPGGLFSLDPISGALSLIQRVDYEGSSKSYSFKVKAQDAGSPPKSSTATLDVRVVDVNDYSPVFMNSSYVVHILETTSADTNIVKVSATDRDSGNNGKVTYSFGAAVDKSKFGLRNGGHIYIKSQLDREEIETYNLKVVASDLGTPTSQSSSVDVKVVIDDVNDNNPKFRQVSYTFFVEENKPAGTSVATLTASDIDKGSNAKLTYTIDTAVEQFSINGATGEITTRQILDREAKGSYVFSVVATDGGSSPRVDKTQVTIVIRDVNDCTPAFNPRRYSKKVYENIVVGSSLLRVTATDADEQGPNSEIEYFIAAGQTSNQVFSMDRITGIMTVVAPLDREKKDRYFLSVVARDKGAPPKDDITFVEVNVLDVNDNLPTFLNLTTFKTVPEKLPVGSVVTRVNAVDNDQGDNGRVQYQIVSGNSGGAFVINATSGVIRTRLALDFERKNRYDLKISATDMGQQQQKSYRWVTIYVEDANDNRPTFDKNPIITWIYENVPTNHTVTTIKAHDDDSGFNSKIWYSIDSQYPKADFKINSETGLIQTIGPIDREDILEYTLIVRATDQAFTEQDRLYSTATLKVIIQDLNDNKPVFVSRNLTYVMEDEPFNFQVTSITALDPDTGPWGTVEYRIVSGDNGKFSLDLKSGVLKLIGSLDHETEPQYTLKISASDEGDPPLQSFQMLDIVVVDVNDNSPEFTKDLFIGNVSEGQPVGTPVVKIIAHDKDSGTNAELTYSIPSGVEKDKFVIDKLSGLIVTNSSLDREKKDTYHLTVHATGVSYPFRVSTTNVRINVLDKNDNPPRFVTPTLTLKVPENKPPFLFYTLAVQDPDAGLNAKVRYRILSGNIESSFIVGESTGALSTTKALDRELRQSYSLLIEAKDVTSPYYSAVANVTVVVEDQNDNTPEFLKPEYSDAISELTAAGTSILNITAVDKDFGSNGNIVYTLSNDTYGIFSIDSKTGILSTVVKFDTSVQQDYSFFCMATDQGADPKMAVVPVKIHIEDKNTHAPQFTQTPYQAHIFPNTTASSLVTIVTATDADTDKTTNGKVTYRIDNSLTTTSLFIVESNTGNVKTSSSFNNPAEGRHVLYVIAEDHGTPPQKGQGIVQIVIGNIQDDPPKFLNQTPSTISIPENTRVGTYVTNVVAKATGNSQVTYSIISGNKGKAFYIDPSSGVITVATENVLDYESIKGFKLRLVATPQGRVSLNGYMTLNIILIDINDNNPSFHPTSIVTQITEDHGDFKSRPVVKVTATDADSGSNANIEYSVVSGNPGSVFSIDVDTGEIKTAKPLNRETIASYELSVKAADTGVPSKFSLCQVKVLVVDVNDNPPVFRAQPEVNLTEDTRLGTVVARAVATDADEDSRLVYTLKTDSVKNIFEVGQFTGDVTLLKALDYEARKSYTLVIAVNDSVHAAELTLKVNVLDSNDNTPTFLNSSYQVTLSESIPYGRSILKVSARDLDSGSNGKIVYSFLVANSDYQIDPDTGVISAKRTIDVGLRDSFNQILVAATDKGTPPQRALVYVRILITREPRFDRASYTGSIPEDAVLGTSVLTVRASDNSPGISLGRISYSIVNNNPFRIGQRSGVISVNGPLDYETESRYLVVVSAVDDTPPARPVSVTVYINVTDVNDEKPVFGKRKYVAQWPESAPVGTNVVNVSATDRDSGSSGRVWFSIESGDDKDSFTINRKTGVIRTKKTLDHDSIKTHHLSVRATDEGTPPQYSDVSVTIQVLDLNDNPPVFHVPSPDDVSVMENAAVGTKFYNLNATDRDSDANGRVTYSIIGGDGEGLFLIDPITGWLRTNATFDYEKTSKYSLQIRAVDSGARPLESNITITVNIGDDDEYDPIFQNDNYDFDVPGNAKVGDVIGKVSASDQDGGAAGVVLFVFHNPKSNALIINITSGVITVNRTLNDGSDLEARRRRSIDDYSSIGPEKESSSKRRVRRAADSKDLDYTIRAYSGKLRSKKFAEVSLRVKVDYTCEGCAIPTTGARGTTGITGTALAVIVGLSVLAGVVLLAFVVVLLLIYSHRKKRRTRQNPPLRFDGSFDEITVHPRTTGNANYATVSSDSIPRAYPPDEYSPLRRNTDSNNGTPTTGTDASETPGSSGSASSGRGSSEGDFEESPAVLVNGDIGGFQSDTNMKTFVADSGIQQDDDQISQLTISDGSGILHVDGFNGSESKSDKTDKTDKILARLEFQSVESMHVFGEEGGGEADGGHDVGNLLYAKLAEADADDESIADDPRPFIDEGRDHPSYGGSLSSIIGSQEELTGSYNWDYLLDWGPQFQPLAEVFSEIGRMKDEGGDKKDVIRNGSIPSSSRLRPQLSGIATVDMLSSMSSLPHSPVSPPSTQYTSPAFSPNFTPAITPLITRSPSVSPLDTGTVSPAYTSRGVTPRSSRPASTHIIRLRQDDDTNSELSHSPSISDNESNLEIDV